MVICLCHAIFKSAGKNMMQFFIISKHHSKLAFFGIESGYIAYCMHIIL